MIQQGQWTKIISPAKINLFLKVTGKRDDGYHNLITLMCPIDLSDTIFIQFEQEKTCITCSHPDVPENKKNLAYRAVQVFFKMFHNNDKKINKGTNIIIKKNIPVGAGLGGGSSNAAKVLLALNHYYDQSFSFQTLLKMGLSLGADVPFFLSDKPAIATGIGEKLNVYKRLKPFWVVVVYPGFSVSTAEVYKNLNLGLTKRKKNLKGYLFDNQDLYLPHDLCNDLETVTERRYPDVRDAKKNLLDFGAKGALMSGSGPTVFGIFYDPKIALRAKEAISSKYKRWEIYLCKTLV